jgi:uncharacterized protein YdcH (DUF465 family)
VANASLEELQKLFVDSLKKLKARDKKIAELTAAHDKLSAEHAASLAQGQGELGGAEAAALERQLRVSCFSLPSLCSRRNGFDSSFPLPAGLA